jgi:hypothetical protein
MSRYFSQLMYQSGVKLATHRPPAPPPSFPREGPTASRSADVAEQDKDSELGAPNPTPVVSVSEIAVRLPADSDSASAALSSQQHREDEEPVLPIQARNAAPESHRASPVETEPRRAPKSAAPPPVDGDSPAQPLTTGRAPKASTASEIVQKVLSWMADSSGAIEPSTSPPAQAKLASAPRQPMAVAAVLQSTPPDRSEELVSPAPAHLPQADFEKATPTVLSGATLATESEAEPWDVHIGAIHLTIEAPAENPSSRRVEPRLPPAPAPSEPRFNPSRLPRHYLRSS